MYSPVSVAGGRIYVLSDFGNVKFSIQGEASSTTEWEAGGVVGRSVCVCNTQAYIARFRWVLYI